MCSIRDYQSADRSACIGIFASNTPAFFGTSEQPEFERFLDTISSPYFVAEKDGVVLGCGGFYCKADRAVLVWGMVDIGYHRHGIGTALVRARLRALAGDRALRTVHIHTSQHSAAFYQKFGFHLNNVIEDHFAPGLHKYEMELAISA